MRRMICDGGIKRDIRVCWSNMGEQQFCACAFVESYEIKRRTDRANKIRYFAAILLFMAQPLTFH